MCVSPFQKRHKQRKAHDDHNVTSDTAIVMGTSFICLCRTDKSVLSIFFFLSSFGSRNAAGCRARQRESAPATISGCHVFPVLKPSCHAFAKPAWQTRPFEDMYRRQKTCNRKPCTHDNDGCRTSVTAAGKRGFPLVRCAAL